VKISFDKNRCTACGLCELACSFHHFKSFLPDKASISVCMDRKGRLEITTLPTCDLCKNEEMPMCVEFCPTGAVKLINKSGEGLKTLRNQLDKWAVK